MLFGGKTANTGKKILLVDDLQESRSIEKSRLESHNYQVDIALNPSEVLQKIKKSHPDLLVMSLSDPRKDGCEVTRVLQSQESTRNIPIVMFIASEEKGLEEQCYGAGVTAIVYKPVLTDLFETIHEVFSSRRLYSAFPVAEKEGWDGLIRINDKSGKLKQELNCFAGKLDGTSREFYESGREKTLWTFKKGKLEGPTKEFYENGVLKEELSYHDGLRQGICKGFYENGKLKWKDHYEKGKKTSSEDFTPEGKLKFEEDY